jgi:hypothetical protein
MTKTDPEAEKEDAEIERLRRIERIVIAHGKCHSRDCTVLTGLAVVLSKNETTTKERG